MGWLYVSGIEYVYSSRSRFFLLTFNMAETADCPSVICNKAVCTLSMCSLFAIKWDGEWRPLYWQKNNNMLVFKVRTKATYETHTPHDPDELYSKDDTMCFYLTTARGRPTFNCQ